MERTDEMNVLMIGPGCRRSRVSLSLIPETLCLDKIYATRHQRRWYALGPKQNDEVCYYFIKQTEFETPSAKVKPVRDSLSTIEIEMLCALEKLAHDSIDFLVNDIQYKTETVDLHKRDDEEECIDYQVRLYPASRLAVQLTLTVRVEWPVDFNKQEDEFTVDYFIPLAEASTKAEELIRRETAHQLMREAILEVVKTTYVKRGGTPDDRDREKQSNNGVSLRHEEDKRGNWLSDTAEGGSSEVYHLYSYGERRVHASDTAFYRDGRKLGIKSGADDTGEHDRSLQAGDGSNTFREHKEDTNERTE